MRHLAFLATAILASSASSAAAPFADRILPAPAALDAALKSYIKLDVPLFALTHVRVIDGTGAPPTEDQTLVVANGRIASIGPATKSPPRNAVVLDLSGHTVLPGLIGMHDHLFYIARPNADAAGNSDHPLLLPEMAFSAPRLYLAAGVTTLRTTGSVEPYTDLNLKDAIDTGKMIGPHMDVTGPYLEGAHGQFIQMHALRDAEDARRTVDFWADQGVTSFKAYMHITRAELAAAIGEVHRRGLKITGHLCSVTYPEAARLGIDNLEHGFTVDTELDPGKREDVCPDSAGFPTLQRMITGSSDAIALIALLIANHVAVTSTLPVREISGHSPIDPRAMEAMSPQARTDYLYARNRFFSRPAAVQATIKREYENNLQLEHAFVAAGGLLLAGPDPTGNGGVVPGFGDQRGVELLVEEGFTPVEAIRIATLNGAIYEGVDTRIGSLAIGKDADIIVVAGDPSRTVADLEKVTIVFKDGVGYDPASLLASVRGRFGEY